MISNYLFTKFFCLVDLLLKLSIEFFLQSLFFNSWISAFLFHVFYFFLDLLVLFMHCFANFI